MWWMRETGAIFITDTEIRKPFGVNQVYWERIQGMRLLDDTLMTAALNDNIEATQFILRILMEKPDLIVTSAKSQVEYKNLYGHSLRMDVDATDSDNDRIDIEIERDRYRAHPKRIRYHSAVRDAHSLRPGQGFRELPTTYMIFITEEDYWGEGLSLYHVNRKVEETGREFGDCAHIIYVNASYQGEDPVGELMADFRESDPGRMRSPELARRIHALKNSEKEVREMCKAMEITYEEGREDGLRQGRVQDVENLMETMGLTLTESLKALRVPMELHQTYTSLIEQRRAARG